MKEPCKHERMHTTVVFLEPAEPSEPRHLAITAMCEDCGHPLSSWEWMDLI